MQLDLSFDSPPPKILSSASPFNQIKVGGQNYKLLQKLLTGAKVNMFTAMSELGIPFLHSRLSDLANKHNLPIQRERITVNGADCMEYWIESADIQRIKEYLK